MTLREDRKQQTQRALLDAALRLSKQGGGFVSVSLREVTREAGLVPTAFYRHWKDMDELGLCVVDDAALTLRRLLRTARGYLTESSDLRVSEAVTRYLHHVRLHAPAFEFLTREQTGGSRVVRDAIARELRFFTGELAGDLRLIATFRGFSAGDLEMVADLLLCVLARFTLDVLGVASGTREERDIEERVVKQVSLILLGARHWKSAAPAGNHP